MMPWSSEEGIVMYVTCSSAATVLCATCRRLARLGSASSTHHAPLQFDLLHTGVIIMPHQTAVWPCRRPAVAGLLWNGRH